MTDLILQDVINALTENVAIVDETGSVVHVNKAWSDFSIENVGDDKYTREGANYFEVIKKSAQEGDEYAIKINDGIQNLLDKKISYFELEYPCHSESEKRWFIANITEIGSSNPRYFLFSHKNVSKLVIREKKIREAQRLEAVGQLAGGIAHDFNNLLSIMLGNLGLAKMHSEEESHIQKYLDETMIAVKRGSSLVQNLLSFSRTQNLAPECVDVNLFIDETLKLLGRVLGEDIDIRTLTTDTTLVIEVDKSMFSSAIINIAINARHAMPGGGTLTIQTASVNLDGQVFIASQEKAYGAFVQISIADTGSGIDQEHLDRVMEPYFTTKEVGQGSGLGLSMVSGFVSQSEGFIDIKSKIGKGTTVSLYLPQKKNGSINVKQDENTVSPISERKTILLVEDDQAVRRVITKMLESLNYNVLQAQDGMKGLDILENSADDIDVVISDVIMPSGMSGFDLHAKIESAHPDIKILLISGYQNLEEFGRTASGSQKILKKPFTLEQLSASLMGL